MGQLNLVSGGDPVHTEKKDFLPTWFRHSNDDPIFAGARASTVSGAVGTLFGLQQLSS